MFHICKSKRLQHTSETDKTFQTNACNMPLNHSQRAIETLVGERSERHRLGMHDSSTSTTTRRDGRAVEGRGGADAQWRVTKASSCARAQWRGRTAAGGARWKEPWWSMPRQCRRARYAARHNGVVVARGVLRNWCGRCGKA